MVPKSRQGAYERQQRKGTVTPRPPGSYVGTAGIPNEEGETSRVAAMLVLALAHPCSPTSFALV